MKGFGSAVIFIGVTVRTLGTFLAVIKGNNLKEKIFICLAWIPKATVQVTLSFLTLFFL